MSGFKKATKQVSPLVLCVCNPSVRWEEEEGQGRVSLASRAAPPVVRLPRASQPT